MMNVVSLKKARLEKDVEKDGRWKVTWLSDVRDERGTQFPNADKKLWRISAHRLVGLSIIGLSILQVGYFYIHSIMKWLCGSYMHQCGLHLI